MISRLLILLTVLSALAQIGLSPQARASGLACKLVIEEKPGILPIESEIKNAQEVSRRLKLQFSKRSRDLKMNLKSGKKNVRYDMIIIGAGPHAASAALAAKDSGLKVLIIDKSDVVASNFYHKEFVVNSVETRKLSMHQFPNTSLRMGHFTSTKYASSHQLAAFLQALIFQSKADVLLKTEVLELQIDSSTQMTQVKTSGLTLEAPIILMATGLGEATTKVRDAHYSELYHNHKKQFEITGQMSNLMSTETFMKLVELSRQKKSTIQIPKSIALIGNGDGARIVIEELLDSHVQLPQDFKIFWIGSDASTTEKYVASQEGWDRYIDRVVPFYKAGIIQTQTGYVTSVKKQTDGLFDITIDQKNKINADMIIDSTGYDNVGKNLFEKSYPGAAFTDVIGNIPFRNVNNVILARQVVINGQPIGNFLVGPAAGPDLVSKEELGQFAARATVSIHLNIPKVYQLVKDLFKIERDEGLVTGEKKETLDVKSPEEILKAIKK